MAKKDEGAEKRDELKEKVDAVDAEAGSVEKREEAAKGDDYTDPESEKGKELPAENDDPTDGPVIDMNEGLGKPAGEPFVWVPDEELVEADREAAEEGYEAAEPRTISDSEKDAMEDEAEGK